MYSVRKNSGLLCSKQADIWFYVRPDTNIQVAVFASEYM